MQWASEHEKHLITIADKSNAIPAHRIWRRVGEQVAADFSQLEIEYRYVDALAMEMVRDPARFDVIITSNLFGDILSDLGAQLVGGLGVAASANLHPGRPGLFEPVHGSAPPLVGTGQANPVGAIVTGSLMLQDLGCNHGAKLLEDGVRASLQAGVATPDLSGGATTSEVAQWIGRWIGDNGAGR
jgi:3-isopropylmalate dehydrogenase